MPVTPPPEYIVRPRLPGSRGQRVLATLLGMALLTASFALGWALAPRTTHAPASGTAADTRELRALKQQLAILRSDRQVTRVATDALRRTLADRGAEIESLRADLAFYTRLIGGDERAPGLSVAAFGLRPLPGTVRYPAHAAIPSWRPCCRPHAAARLCAARCTWHWRACRTAARCATAGHSWWIPSSVMDYRSPSNISSSYMACWYCRRGLFRHASTWT